MKIVSLLAEQTVIRQNKATLDKSDKKTQKRQKVTDGTRK